MEKVVVLMSSYNGERYIRKQIESLLAQTGISVSILVRDDGSQDDTVHILEEYSSSGRLEWYTGKHLNVGYSFYNLMERVEDHDADYLAFCDQDDVWDGDKLSIAVCNLIQIHADIPALYYCGQRLVDKKLNFIEEHRLNEKRSLASRFILSDIAGCTAVFNRSLLTYLLAYKPKYMLMHDTWILKVCLALGGHVIVDPEPHLDYRQHGGNTVGLKHDIISQIKRAKEYIFEYHIERQISLVKKGYYDMMVDEYKILVDHICKYRYNRESRNILLDKRYIDFYDWGLNLTYRTKVRLNKL